MMGRFTDAEMQARIDAALSGYEGQEAGVGPDPGGASVDSDVVEAIGEIDSPISAVGDRWRVVAMAAWWALTGRGELPEWFDDWTTIGEMARRSGRSRSEVRDALDAAKGPLVGARDSTGCRCWQCELLRSGWPGRACEGTLRRERPTVLPPGIVRPWINGVSPFSPVRADRLSMGGVVWVDELGTWTQALSANGQE